ncbi:gamma carbonic anhydrase family protein [Fusibacter sp. 3D3]|uniref:gamma carbonic anhydrase family protein n=1 Tax=Fusibacter sp. 3D3 TaxID=1048380 RepID=UPI000852F1F0|nr:gamma carbonic anhydrase family protein [Fusibacter sp. 3D3]GAU76908.1 carbonic anhydrase, family 3 [Fusibacter sp. 3D3]
MIKVFKSHIPQIQRSCFIAESADIIGEVIVEESANIWYNTVVRGDVEPIFIGNYTNVQDQVVIHTSQGFPVSIGPYVTIGHGAIVHGCTVEDHVLIGMGAIVLDGAYIEKNCIIGAGALIPPNKRIPSNSLVVGSPGKIVRTLSNEEIEHIEQSAIGYVELSQHHKSK